MVVWPFSVGVDMNGRKRGDLLGAYLAAIDQNRLGDFLRGCTSSELRVIRKSMSRMSNAYSSLEDELARRPKRGKKITYKVYQEDRVVAPVEEPSPRRASLKRWIHFASPPVGLNGGYWKRTGSWIAFKHLLRRSLSPGPLRLMTSVAVGIVAGASGYWFGFGHLWTITVALATGFLWSVLGAVLLDLNALKQVLFGWVWRGG